MINAAWNAVRRPSKSSESARDAHPSLKLSLPPPPLPSEIFDSADWFWYEGKRVRRAPRGVVDADEDEYDVGHLNLGTETPLSISGSMSPYPFPPSRGSINSEHRSNGEVTTREGNNTSLKRRLSQTSKKNEGDRECGICLESAVKPCRTRCCGTMFCSDHLNDWLVTSDCCPNCNSPLTIGEQSTSGQQSGPQSSETPKQATPFRGSLTPHAAQGNTRTTSTSRPRFHIATPDSLSGAPTPPPPYQLTGDDIALLAEELNLGSLLSSTSLNGTDTPTVWTPTAFSKGSKHSGSNRRPGIYDAVFSSEAETLTTASRLATLVAFVLLLYVVLG